MAPLTLRSYKSFFSTLIWNQAITLNSGKLRSFSFSLLVFCTSCTNRSSKHFKWPNLTFCSRTRRLFWNPFLWRRHLLTWTCYRRRDSAPLQPRSEDRCCRADKNALRLTVATTTQTGLGWKSVVPRHRRVSCSLQDINSCLILAALKFTFSSDSERKRRRVILLYIQSMNPTK